MTPPGRSAHVFEHTATDEVERYRPPPVDGVPMPVGYGYDQDRQLVLVTRPDGTAIGPGSRRRVVRGEPIGVFLVILCLVCRSR